MLIGEVIHRILSVFQKINPDNLKKSNLIKIISCITVYFQDINFKYADKNDSLTIFVETIRSSIFLFISKIFSNSSLCATWMGHPVFCSSFFTFIFEHPIRPFILRMLKFYLIDATSPIHIHVIDGIKDICTFAFSRFPNPQYVLVSCDTLETLNDFLTHRSSYISSFADMVNSVCTAVNSLVKSEINGNFLLQAIHFFALASSTQVLNRIQLSTISDATIKIFENEPSSEFFSKYVQLLAGAKLSSISPSFVIRQPKALRTMVEVYKKSSKFTEILDFIYSLINYSYENALVVQSISFAEELLDFINLHKSDNELSSQTIEIIFSIVSHISCLIGTVFVVQKFISLLCPINGKYISHYQPLFIQKLTEIISVTMKAPKAWLPLKFNASFIQISDISSQDIPNKFTVLFWIYVDQPSSQSHMFVFNIFDRKSRGLSAFVTSRSLLVTSVNKLVESTARCEMPLPARTWTPVMLRFSFMKNKTIVVPIIDHYICRRLEFSYEGFKSGPLYVHLGNSPDEKNENDISQVFLSSFALMPYGISSEDFAELFDPGPRLFLNPVQQHKCLFGISLDITNSELTVNHVGDVKTAFVGPVIVCQPTFCDVLLSINKAEVFLPLFSMLDMTTLDNILIKSLPEYNLDLISSMLLINDDVQASFKNAGGFKIISHLLAVSKTWIPTYTGYIRYYNLLLSLTYQPLQKSLVKYILTSFPLLIKSEKYLQSRIVKHWARTLYYTNTKKFVEVHSIASLLSAISQYFDEDKDQYEDDIRKNLFYLITNISIEYFSSNDFKILVSYILYNTNKKVNLTRVSKIFEIFKLTLQSNESSSKVFKSNQNLLFSLHEIVKSEDKNLFIELIDFIIELHKCHSNNENKTIKAFPIPSSSVSLDDDFLTLQQHLDMLLIKIVPGLISEDLLNALIVRINENNVNELIPMCCFIARNIDDVSVNDMFNKINPRPLQSTSLFWILGIACCSPFDIRSKIVKYVINSMIEVDIESIFSPIEILATCFSDDYLKHEVIIQLASLLMNINSHEIYDTFFHYAFSFIFFHQKTHTKVIEEEFSMSPFAKGNKAAFPKRRSKAKRGNNQDFSELRASTITSQLNSLATINSIESIDSLCDSCELEYYSKVQVSPVSNSFSRNAEWVNNFKVRSLSSLSNSNIAEIDNLNSNEIFYETGLSYLRSDTSNHNFDSISKQLSLDKFPKTLLTSDKEFQVKSNHYSNNQLNGQLVHNPNDVKFLDEKQVFSLSPSFIYEKLKSYSNNHTKKVFLIRTDKNGRWLDLDAANLIIRLFEKWADPLHLDFALLIISFQIKYMSNSMEIERVLRKLALNHAQIKANNLLLHLIKRNIENYKRRIYVDYLPESLKDILAFKSLYHIQLSLKQRMKTSSSISKKYAYNFMKSYSHVIEIMKVHKTQEFDRAYNENISEFINREKKMIEKNNKQWTRYWRSMTYELAPWESAVVNSSQTLYERDLLLNKMLIPTLMKRKLHFDDAKSHEKLLKETNNKQKVDRAYYCVVVSPRHEKEAKLEIHKNFVRFIFGHGIRTVRGESIRFLFLRSRFFINSCFEMVLHNGKNYFVDITSNINSVVVNQENSNPKDDDRKDLVISIIKSIAEMSPYLEKPPILDPLSIIKTSNITNLWVNRKMSNFKYLISLNILGGRSFNDLTQYPIFPWILSNYESENIDFSNGDIFRDLRKPMMAINDERLTNLSKNGGFLNLRAPVYPGSVKQYLERSPYRSHVEENLDENHQETQKTFDSIPETFKSVTNHDNDFRELIPEFFFFPVFLDKTTSLKSVELPKWVPNNNSLEFIYMHRKALESDFVSLTLNYWIDLIFGYKQSGLNSKSASNIYPEFMTSYSENSEDLIREKGQLPYQLFHNAHPQRDFAFMKSKNGSMVSVNDKILLSYDTELSDTFYALIDSSKAPETLIFSLISLTGTVHKIEFNFENENSSSSASNSESSPSISTSDSSLDTNVNLNISSTMNANTNLNTNSSVNSPLTIKNSSLFNTDHSSNLSNSNLANKTSYSSHHLSTSTFDCTHISSKKSSLGTMVPIGNHCFATTNSQENHILYVDLLNNSSKLSRTPFGNVWYLSTSENLIATVGTDMMTRVYHFELPERPLLRTPSYRGETSCVSISENFGVFVSGTRDGSIQICSLINGDIQCVVKMGQKRMPLHTIISNEWGFIVVFTESNNEQNSKKIFEILLYTINGQFVRSCTVENELTAWTTWTDSQGFDFLAMALAGGKVMSLEIFYLEPGEIFFRASNDVVSMKYIESLQSIVMVTKTGKIILSLL